jgi:hypothetical protein
MFSNILRNVLIRQLRSQSVSLVRSVGVVQSIRLGTPEFIQIKTKEIIISVKIVSILNAS